MHPQHHHQQQSSSAVAVDSGDGSSEEPSDEEYAWISYFSGLKGNEYFCEVEVDFIHDNFNLTGLSAQVPYYEFALDVILDVESNDDHLSEEQQELIEAEAELLYGLIHARYILTKRGLHAMYEKYRAAEFGRCPRVYCNGQAMLPIGLHDVPHKSVVKLYCPRCEDVYNSPNRTDGSYFGTSFPNMFFLEFPELKPSPPEENYVSRIFGFKMHESSHVKALDAKLKNKSKD